MHKAIDVVFEDGVFKPLEKVNVKEHKKIKILLTEEVEYTSKEACTLAGIIDIAKDCLDIDLSTNHDKYLYGEVLD